jgi:hypothetical protein
MTFLLPQLQVNLELLKIIVGIAERTESPVGPPRGSDVLIYADEVRVVGVLSTKDSMESEQP